MSPPIHVPSRSGGGAPGIASRSSRTSLGSACQRLSSTNQSPWRISSTTRGPPRAHLVRLPQNRHLLGDLLPDAALRRVRQLGIVEPAQRGRRAAGGPGASFAGSPRSDARSARAAPRCALPRRAAPRRRPRLRADGRRRRRATRAARGPRARTGAAAAGGGAAPRCSRAGRRARTRAAPRDCCSRSSARIASSSSAAIARLARVTRQARGSAPRARAARSPLLLDEHAPEHVAEQAHVRARSCASGALTVALLYFR